MSVMMQPVFWDPTGRRAQRVAIRLFVSLMIGAMAIFAGWQMVMKPLMEPVLHADSGYPRAAVSGIDEGEMPVIGMPGVGVLNRVVKVDRRPEGVWLVDPFTNQVIREANNLDLDQIHDEDFAVDYYARPPDKQLMLTFDDGPDARYTPQILDILSREGVPATFFVLGQQVAHNPGMLQRIIREGHMVGNHTMTHHDFDTQTDWRNRTEVLMTDRLIRAAGNYDTPLFRIPRGDPDNNAMALLFAQQQGMSHVNMDVDTLDWNYLPGESVPVPQLDGAGHVVLMHDAGGDRSATIVALETLIREAKAQGYSFSTVAPLLSSDQMPQTGISPSFADRTALWVVQAVWVVPGMAMGGLFWFGVLSLTIMTVVYLLLAAIHERRLSRREWSHISDDDLPFVTIVIPAYNEGRVMVRTFDALRASLYPADKLQVIAVDDGSTDDTLEVMLGYALSWEALRIYTQQNGGKAAALNHGISRARRESTVIVTLDADTLFTPDTLLNMVRHFVGGVHEGEVGSVAGHVKVGNRRNVVTAWQSLEYISGICVTRTAEGLMGAISIVPGACSAWSRKALNDIGGFTEQTLAEDADATLTMQRRGYRVVQDNHAIAFTEAPETIVALARQRKRWMFGTMQALWKHRGMMLHPGQGMLGMVALPYAALSMLVPLLFLPFTTYIAIRSSVTGDWRSVALFAAFVAGVHMLVSIAGIAIARERWWHLLVVPVYRLIYEPLRAYLLYVSLARIVRGRLAAWDKLERMNSASTH